MDFLLLTLAYYWNVQICVFLEIEAVFIERCLSILRKHCIISSIQSQNPRKIPLLLLLFHIKCIGILFFFSCYSPHILIFTRQATICVYWVNKQKNRTEGNKFNYIYWLLQGKKWEGEKHVLLNHSGNCLSLSRKRKGIASLIRCHFQLWLRRKLNVLTFCYSLGSFLNCPCNLPAIKVATAAHRCWHRNYFHFDCFDSNLIVCSTLSCTFLMGLLMC